MEEHSDDVSLGTRLRAQRRSLGLTLSEVADAAAVSMTYLSNIERGRGNPTLEVLTRIAAALGVDVGALVGNRAPSASDEPIDVVLASAPRSLLSFSRSEHFARTVERLAQRRGDDVAELRTRLLRGMAAAPRRSRGDPTSEDWKRLLDAYQLILDED